MSERILTQIDNNVCFITINRPDNYNSIDLATAKELADVVEQCFDPEIRAVVITGAGKAFCSGGDLAFMQEEGDLSKVLGDIIKHINRYTADIRRLPKPVIAAVNGVAAGGGFALALACDLRIASARAKFKQAYTSGALVPDGGWSIFAPVILGLSRASEMLFLDPLIDAETALQLGIVNKVVEESSFNEEIKALAFKLAQAPTGAFGEGKALINSILLPNLETHLEKERQGMIRAGKTADAVEGLDAFLNKRSPSFTGK